jgi:nanoRNase/pAp phosphatase (c-di-AMP/oligoRNAs hydrolase)
MTNGNNGNEQSDGLDLDRSRAGLEAALGLCERPGRVLIVMQDNPDPDAIASAAALRAIIYHKLHKRAIIGYGGVIGRAENRAMLGVLGIEAHNVSQEELIRYRTICLVDAQPNSGNNILTDRRQADLVIDHHQVPRRLTWKATHTDLRPEYGAAATILYEYLLVAEMTPHVRLATALFYGIQSDTQDLGRKSTPADVEAFQQLFLMADKSKLARIRRAHVPPEYFLMLRDSLERCVVAGSAVITSVDASDNPDIFAEMADRMMRLEGAHTSVCYGRSGDIIYVSARVQDGWGNAAKRMKRVVSRLGTGGGHKTMAGGQVPAGDNPPERMRLVYDRILKHFGRGKKAQPLLPGAQLPVETKNDVPLANPDECDPQS